MSSYEDNSITATENYQVKSYKDFFDKHAYIISRNRHFGYYKKGINGETIVFLHGAGQSSLSWSYLINSMGGAIDFEAYAIDLRCHGTSAQKEHENSLEFTEIVELYQHYIYYSIRDIESILYSLNLINRNIMLVGHSLGACIAVELAVRGVCKVSSIVIIEMAEETAKRSLLHIKKVLFKRPKRFETVLDAITWSVNNDLIKNIKSAYVSIPSQLQKNDDGYYEWIIDLIPTEKLWNGWFEGFNDKIISLQIPKIIVLTGIEKLDRSLLTAQMQGKLQVTFVKNCSHNIHEDKPEEIARIIISLIKRKNTLYNFKK